jgi:dTDP-4-dehydrorhamnose 3,5-epimerase-like enzyme
MKNLGFIKKFSNISDSRGSLLPIEIKKEFGFDVERIYFLYDSTAPRGFHAHRELQQIMVAVKGSCTVLLDDGRNRQKYLLNSNNEALFIDKLLWREIYSFSKDCILLVAASLSYSEDDYFRDYNSFLQHVSSEFEGRS